MSVHSAMRSSSHRRRSLFRPIVVSLLCLGGLIYLFPVLWMVLTSFKRRVDIFTLTPTFHFSPTFSNYIKTFIDHGFGGNLLNSIIVTGCATVLAITIGLPAAYSVSRHRTALDGTFLLSLLSARILPVMVLSVPLFVMAARLGLSGSYVAVIAAHLSFILPFAIWMMRGFFVAIPSELDEAAKVDGCTTLSAFIRIVLPLSKGGVAATAIFCAINSWNDFLYALVLTSAKTATLPVSIPTLHVPSGTHWGQLMAVGTVTILPILIFAFAVQKHIVTGITGGALSDE